LEREWTTKPLKYGKKGDVFICVVGATSGKLNLGIDCSIGRSVAAIRPKEGTDTRFIYYQLLPWVLKLRASSSGSAQGVISKKQLNEVPIQFAPLEQQKRIVEEIEKQFSRLDEAVANLKRVKANLKRYKAAVLKAAVEGKLTEEWRKQHPDVEPADKLLERILEERRANWQGRGKYKEPVVPDTTGLPELPVGWVWATVAQISKVVQYGSSSKTSEDETGIPVLRMGNIINGSLDWEKLKFLPANHDEFPELFLKSGDMLFNRTNSPELVGKTAVYEGTIEPCSFASYLIRVRVASNYSSKFLSYYINSHFGRMWVKSVVTQQVGQANVNGTKLQALFVPVPPLDEQGEIVSVVESRLSLIERLENQVDVDLKRSDRLRQSILKKAFSGQLTVQ